jgi:myosin heavy subunit
VSHLLTIFFFFFPRQKPLGLLFLLDEECNFPNATDESFLDKCHKQYEKHEFYDKPKTRKPTFGVKHYAGLVTYQVEGFLEKNRDTLRADMLDLLKDSKNPLIAELFKPVEENASSGSSSPSSPVSPSSPGGTLGRSGSLGRGFSKGSKVPTIGAQFYVRIVCMRVL